MFSSKAVMLAIVFSALHATNAQAAEGKSKPFLFNVAKSQTKPDNYLGASLGKTNKNGFCDELASCNDAEKNWKAFMGVRMNDTLVLETAYTRFGEQQGQDMQGNTATQTATAISTTAVIGHDLADGLEVFGKAGMARWSADQTFNGKHVENNGMDVLIGAGANYDLGDNLGLRAEWERYKDVGASAVKQGDIDLLSVGMTYSSL